MTWVKYLMSCPLICIGWGEGNVFISEWEVKEDNLGVRWIEDNRV